MKKYELTDETVEIGGHTLHRIKALVDFGYVKAGDIGGWIEKGENLSQDGDAWVYKNARVYGDARVAGNVQVYGNSLIYDGAWVYGSASIYDSAQVYGSAEVYGSARVYGNARVYGDAQVYGSTRVYDNALVYGSALVDGNPHIGGGACVRDNTHYVEVGPIGSWNYTVTFVRDRKGEIFAKVGCFFGTLDEFRKKVEEAHGNNAHAEAYLLAAKLAEVRIDTTPIDDEGK